jgi:hypothetical protein
METGPPCGGGWVDGWQQLSLRRRCRRHAAAPLLAPLLAPLQQPPLPAPRARDAGAAHLVHRVAQRRVARQRQRHGALQLVLRQRRQRGAQLLALGGAQRGARGGRRLAQLAHRGLQLLKLLQRGGRAAVGRGGRAAVTGRGAAQQGVAAGRLVSSGPGDRAGSAPAVHGTRQLQGSIRGPGGQRLPPAAAARTGRSCAAAPRRAAPLPCAASGPAAPPGSAWRPPAAWAPPAWTTSR